MSNMSTISLDFDRKKDVDVSQLLAENKTLASELKQCQADKEFVWSLWKRLQVSNPDVTEAISLVIQREKEKSEAKDLKVLEILQIKDDRIEELQNIVAKQSLEISDLLTKKVDLQEQTGRFQAECDQLQDRLTSSQAQVKRLETKEQSSDEIHRQTITNTQREKHEFQRRITELSTEMEIVRAEKADSLAKRLNLENKIRTLDREVSDKVTKFQSLVQELEEANQKLQRFEEDGRQQQREITYKNRELENVRKELSELWASHNQLTEHSSQQAELIRQLQSLQLDTQKMMKNQEDAFSMESTSLQQMYTDLSSRYEISQRTETSLRKEILALKQDALEKDDPIGQLKDPSPTRKTLSGDLEGSYLNTRKAMESPVVDWEYKVEEMQREMDSLRLKLQEKERIIREFGDQSLEFDVSRLNKHERTHSTPSRDVRSTSSPQHTPRLRSRSVSPASRDGQHHYCTLKRKLADSEHLLELKSRELVELRKAHGQRLDRLRSLQNSYRLVKEQLKTLEDDSLSGKKKLKPPRSDPRELQKENSDQVWNELSHFKSENRKLLTEMMAMQEELDMFRVQAAQDAALVHELNLKLEQAYEDVDFQEKKREYEHKAKTDMSSEVTILKSSVQNKDAVLEKLEKQLQEVTVERDRLLEEKRQLKSTVLMINKESSQQRIEIANLKKDIHRLEREVEESSRLQTSREASVPLSDSCSESRPNTRPTPSVPVSRIRRRGRTTKKYQASLNKSIEKMKAMFSDFNEEGWEEISDNLTTEEDTLTENDTLGRAIVTRSRTDMVTSETSDTGTRRTVERVDKKARMLKAQPGVVIQDTGVRPSVSQSQESLTTSSSDTLHRVVLRETATSPIPFGTQLKERAKKGRFQMVTPAMRQLGSLKQRVWHLQQQIAALRDSRGQALKNLSEQKEANQQSQSDLNLANQRLRLTKQTVQRLTVEVERMQKEKGEMEKQLFARGDDSASTMNTLHERHNDQEWKVLETRLKVSSNELSRQSATIRNLKTENEGLQQQLKSLQERINHIERDNSQKRALVESQRTKLKYVQEEAKTDGDRITDLETKVCLLSETNDKMKTQMESSRRRMSVAVREKQDCEDKYCKAVLDVEKKTKLYCEAKAKCGQLEEALAELEKTAKQQLHGLATQSEAAIDAAQEQLTNSHTRIQQYQLFVKALGKELVLRVEHTRGQVKDYLVRREKHTQPVDFSLQKAQDVAKNILNLSQSDLEDIMSADGDMDTEPDLVSEVEKKNNRRWIKKCEKISSNKDFVLSLVNHFLQKVDERGELLLQLQS
ncbi:centlein-like isoform X2 [Haliotis rufescens]|uniref:centlein-like isoform X2 n=1 Tax=Haliotis rufescens TaxID=6454 RepID=UPI00201ECE06|nr:centlein-like isoform X2 [Haliotis rufescens]